MNKWLLERVERGEVEPEYAPVTLRLLQAELWTVGTSLYSNPGDQELMAFKKRVQRAIEGLNLRI